MGAAHVGLQVPHAHSQAGQPFSRKFPGRQPMLPLEPWSGQEGRGTLTKAAGGTTFHLTG